MSRISRDEYEKNAKERNSYIDFMEMFGDIVDDDMMRLLVMIERLGIKMQEKMLTGKFINADVSHIKNVIQQASDMLDDLEED